MEDNRRRCKYRVPAQELGAEREIDVLDIHPEILVKAIQGFPKLAAHGHCSAAAAKHVLRVVELAAVGRPDTPIPWNPIPPHHVPGRMNAVAFFKEQ